MAQNKSVNKNQIVIKTLIYGVITAAFYAAAFSNADLLMSVFTRGGYYAAFPIATVFAFSFAHGSFASNLWSALGVEAITKSSEVRAEKVQRKPAKRPRPRVRMSV